MSRDKNYQRLLNSKEWKQLRRWKLEQNPLCELCQAEGKVVAAIDVHHMQPVETARSLEDMRALCFNPANLQSLCIMHHAKVHKELKSHTREAHQQRQADAISRWVEKHRKK